MKNLITAFLLIALFGFIKTVKCQTVENIKVEQAGDFIKIRYQITNSTPTQVYRIKVLCSINGGMNTEIRSVSGDVGDQVIGGKAEYWVVWDVLKDIDEIKSVEFIVRAELIRDNTPLISKKNKENSNRKRNFNIMASAQFPGPSFGIRTGYMGKSGFSFQYIHGLAVLTANSGIKQTDRPQLTRVSFDYTGRLINKEIFQMHLILGFTLAETVFKKEYISQYDGLLYSMIKINVIPGGELGLAFCSRKLTFALTCANVFTKFEEDEQKQVVNKHTFLTLSFGLRF